MARQDAKPRSAIATAFHISVVLMVWRLRISVKAPLFEQVFALHAGSPLAQIEPGQGIPTL